MTTSMTTDDSRRFGDFTALRVEVEAGVAHLTIDNPPVNTLDVLLITELGRFFDAVSQDERVRVVVLQSADPEFFSAHADVNFMFDPESLMRLAAADGDPSLNPLQQMNERLRTLPQVTIAKLAGRLRAGGSELAMAADMRFAAKGRTWLSQPETRMGIFPGGGGTQYLTRLMGRARAVEVILGAELFDAELAERYGWINRALPPEELDGFVDALARRIAALPPGVAAAAMEAVDAAEAGGPVPRLSEESTAHGKVYPSPDAVVDRMRTAMRAGVQTREGEVDLEGLLDRVSY
ncbi:enoyl-CoA hydratase/isomerase family protein [Streptomyces aurantiacus]|uniref:Enoyl-CoA hydratase n=1 Tax=Streptomyces aurantiacus TaxID=47760 RepID=A0A7G1NYG1_9ACTN|nr:enoyl-CoA hydratase/isomerase family protein [Streptomyces aurantiacus]BCL26674.1 enoyl-CoA hydratase [Streptomyces aurantiacus]